ncbi:MAG: CHAP domain-containing protein [Daejeonella sp.]
MTRAEFIVSAACYYIGQLEKPGNAGFKDANFEKELRSVGWVPGQAWCAYLPKLIYRKAYKDNVRLLKVVNSCNTGGAQMTFNNHKTAGTFEVSNDPLPGSIVIWQLGETFKGHAGIVEKMIDTNTIQTIEGNTNANGSREGDRVARKLRTLNRPFKKDGLNLLGFINPVEL